MTPRALAAANAALVRAMKDHDLERMSVSAIAAAADSSNVGQ